MQFMFLNNSKYRTKNVEILPWWIFEIIPDEDDDVDFISKLKDDLSQEDYHVYKSFQD